MRRALEVNGMEMEDEVQGKELKGGPTAAFSLSQASTECSGDEQRHG